MPMQQWLPNDILRVIDDFAQCANLAVVNQTCLSVLRFRRVHLSSHTLGLQDSRFGEVTGRLAELKGCASLQQLTLDLRANHFDGIGDVGAGRLAELKECASLRQLTLDLGDNSIGEVGAGPLAAELKECASLQQLTFLSP